jgi:hypothetical protein
VNTSSLDQFVLSSRLQQGLSHSHITLVTYELDFHFSWIEFSEKIRSLEFFFFDKIRSLELLQRRSPTFFILFVVMEILKVSY